MNVNPLKKGKKADLPDINGGGGGWRRSMVIENLQFNYLYFSD